VEAAQELKTLRAKAHQVLHNTLRRRMRNALASWEAYVEYCEAKRAKLALAERHWRQLYRRHGMAAWSAFVKVRWEGRWFGYMVCDIAKLCPQGLKIVNLLSGGGCQKGNSMTL
jgi:hypothetical protein